MITTVVVAAYVVVGLFFLADAYVSISDRATDMPEIQALADKLGRTHAAIATAVIFTAISFAIATIWPLFVLAKLRKPSP